MRLTGIRLPAIVAPLGLGIGLLVCGRAAGYSLDSTATQLPTATTPIICGQPVTSWGAATAGDVQIGLLSATIEQSQATPSPSAGRRWVAEIEVENRAGRPVTIDISDITLTLCDRRILAVTPVQGGPPFATDPIPPDTTRTGSIEVILDDAAIPALLTIPITRDDLTGSRVDFRLVTDDLASPNAETGAGQSGATGGDAIGGDAVGGDGADGENAAANTSATPTCPSDSETSGC